jgi:hypothetical protein
VSKIEREIIDKLLQRIDELEDENNRLKSQRKDYKIPDWYNTPTIRFGSETDQQKTELIYQKYKEEIDGR